MERCEIVETRLKGLDSCEGATLNTDVIESLKQGDEVILHPSLPVMMKVERKSLKEFGQNKMTTIIFDNTNADDPQDERFSYPMRKLYVHQSAKGKTRIKMDPVSDGSSIYSARSCEWDCVYITKET